MPSRLMGALVVSVFLAGAAAGGGWATPSVHFEDAQAHRGDRLTFARGAGVTVPLRTRAAAAALQREVLGFLPYWALAEGPLLDYDALSTVAYWGVGATPAGRLAKRSASGSLTTEWRGWRSAALTSVIEEAHADGTRVVLTVVRFAWTPEQAAATARLLASRAARARLAAEIASAVAARGVDGVNLDFEPVPAGRRAQFVRLVRRVRRELDARSPAYTLTVDAPGSPWHLGGYDVAALTAEGAVDAIFVMGYDYRIASSRRAGGIAPLRKPGDDLTDSLAAFLSLMGPEKIILGLPWYGRAWSTRSDAPHARTRSQGPRFGYSSTVRYGEAMRTASLHGRRYDAVEATTWTAYRYRYCPACPRTWRELYFDGRRSLRTKYGLANVHDLAGVGIWALGYSGARRGPYQLLKESFSASP